jgi:MFS family permease
MKTKRERLFYGWIIVIIAALNMVLIYGMRNCFSVFFVAILNEFGWERASTALMFSSNLIIYGTFAPFVGTLVDRLGPRIMIPVGAVLLAGGLALCSLLDQLWQFYLVYGVVMGVGICFAGYPVHVPMLSNWFVRRRGMAMGLALAGIGGSFLIAPLAEVFISSWDWRIAYLILGLITITIVIPITLLFLRARPEDMGEQADKSNDKQEDSITKKARTFGQQIGLMPLKLSSIMKGKYFWLVFASWFLSLGVGWCLLLTHQVALAIDAGYSAGFAASIFGLVGIFNAIGHLSSSFSDRIGREKSYVIGCLGAIIALIFLLQVKDANHPWILYIYAVVFGFSGGIINPTGTAISADLFHSKNFGFISGTVNSLPFALGGGFAPWLGGFIYDHTGSYNIALYIAISAWLGAGICIGLIGIFKKE